MKKGRHHRAALLGPVKRDVPEIFFRLCHHCLFLNESELEIQECKKCEHKFNFTEKDDFLPVSEEQFLDQQMEEDEEIHERTPPQKKTALTGLDVKW
ncbi:MAG: hypothetical protein EBQ92_07695 [Proteobacteria bacterium]|nr:hypothetical protein [Pseudomonadota bacterium]